MKNNNHENGPDWLARGLFVAFVVVIAISMNMVFNIFRDISSGEFGSVDVLDLPPVTPGESGEVPIVIPTQAPAPIVELETWDGSSRVNILVMGLDFRDWTPSEGPPRTDTMILFTIDPNTNTAGMVSIPRDLWVYIPGFEHGKINTAYQLGEGSQLPGRGPGLAVATVEQFLGVTIHYYAQIDFGAFVDFINLIGGVIITVEEPITFIVMYKPVPVTLEPGVHTLPGNHALAYARTRSTEGGDFDRADRQQQVITAIRTQMLQRDVQATILTNAFEVYQGLSAGIQTNMTFDQAFQLGMLALQIDMDDVQRGIIGPPDHVLFDVSPDGLDILKPIPDRIRLLRDQIFTSQTTTNLAAANASLGDLMLAEAASVGVYNGTSTAGLAGSSQEYLMSLGMNITEIGNAEATIYTTIIDYTGNPYTLQFLLDLIGVTGARIFHSFDPNSPLDLEIILGTDWSLPQ